MSSFLSPGDLGDIIQSLLVVKRLGGGIYYLSNRPDICKPMTPARFEALRALMIVQPYISKVEWHKGQHVTYDLTSWRHCHSTQKTLAEAQAAHICPFKALDLSAAWLTVPEFETHGRPVLARSARYHNPEWQAIWPQVLERYQNPIFIGTKEEHTNFCVRFGHKTEFVPTPTLLDVAKLIAGSSIFIGNQSSPNSIAEGLKHAMIQETHPKVRDCIFAPRANCHYVATRWDWIKVTQQVGARMGLVLQVHPGDVYQGLELVKLITDIEPVMRHDEFFISYRRDTNEHAIKDIEKVVRTKFARVHLHKCRGRAVGHPVAPNEMWTEIMDTILYMHKRKATTVSSVLTFEPDDIPLRPDWIDVLKLEWEHAQSLGFDCFGHAHNDPKTHINGNAVFAVDFHALYPKVGIAEPRTGWDVASGPLLLKVGMDSPTIYQKYRIQEISKEDVLAIRKEGTIPALFHGIKTLDGINAVRQMIADGSFKSRLTDASDRLTSEPCSTAPVT